MCGCVIAPSDAYTNGSVCVSTWSVASSAFLQSWQMCVCDMCVCVCWCMFVCVSGEGRSDYWVLFQVCRTCVSNTSDHARMCVSACISVYASSHGRFNHLVDYLIHLSLSLCMCGRMDFVMFLLCRTCSVAVQFLFLVYPEHQYDFTKVQSYPPTFFPLPSGLFSLVSSLTFVLT